MKSLLYIFIIVSIVACQSKTTDEIPTDLPGKRTYLQKKKAELKEMQAEINILQKELNKLDPPKEKTPINVETIVVSRQEVKRYIDVQAQVMADDIVNASSELGGRILSLTVKEGDYVNKGQLIASTDMSTIEKQMSEIKTSLSLATTIYERQKKLWDQNIGSELQFLETKTNKERLEGSLETLNSQLNKKNIYAPLSGIVDRTFLSQGEMTSPGMPIIQILNTNKLKVVAELQESLLGTVEKGDIVEVYYPVLDKTVNSRVSMIGRSIDPANRTFKIEITTSSLKGQLKPYLMAQVKLNDFTQKDAIAIPVSIVQEEVTGEKIVFKAIQEKGKWKAKKTTIELGESIDDLVIISIGLKADDILCTDGAKVLSDNDLINFNQ